MSIKIELKDLCRTPDLVPLVRCNKNKSEQFNSGFMKEKSIIQFDVFESLDDYLNDFFCIY